MGKHTLSPCCNFVPLSQLNQLVLAVKSAQRLDQVPLSCAHLSSVYAAAHLKQKGFKLKRSLGSHMLCLFGNPSRSLSTTCPCKIPTSSMHLGKVFHQCQIQG